MAKEHGYLVDLIDLFQCYPPKKMFWFCKRDMKTAGNQVIRLEFKPRNRQ